ncbi:hypothetical protein ES703_09060 [subsurface metagenome]
MKLRRVKIDDVKVPETRVTARFDPELWEQFQHSMKETGAIAPIIVYQVEEELVLCDGLHRLVEAKNNGDNTIMAAIIPGDMGDVLTKNIFLDHLRGKTPVSEMVSVIETLWKELGLDSEKIAEKTGLTRDYVEKLQKLSELTPLIREVLDQGKIGVGHAFALTKIEDPARQEMVFNQWLLYHWPIREFEDYIKSILEIVEEAVPPETPPEERPPVKIRCKFCGELHDVAQISNPATCVVCSGIMFGAVAAARAEAAEEKLPSLNLQR